MSKLVIVESPAKAKTIEKYLPDGYTVLASLGHVRDLPDNASQLPKEHQGKPWSKLGVDIENDFEAIYVVKDPRSKKAVSELKSALKDADELILATDEDREGEAISWHLQELLRPKVPTTRMVFNEITQTAIRSALDHKRDIDMNLVAAQETRRILDRLVGYPLSMLVRKKINHKLSAGRVQSAAVRMLVERERERRRFKIGSYWDIKAELTANDQLFQAVLDTIDNVRIASGKDFDENTGRIAEGKNVLLVDEDTARGLTAALASTDWSVASLTERKYPSRPKGPFTTSTLQQEASRKLGLGAQQTMSVAQRLYENGFITYMRTDSTNLSTQAVEAARSAAVELYGPEYVPDSPRVYRSKGKNAQEAHEAIRPSGDRFVKPEGSGLSGIELRLYDLIWKRTVACQMSDAQRTSIRADLVTEHDGKTYTFRANGNRIDFPGYIRAYFEGSDDPEAALEDSETVLPAMAEGDAIGCQELTALSHETKPPARYTEASLVRALEEAGVGRPSTYATIMNKITNDARFARKEGRTLIPTYQAFAVTGLLEGYFPELVESHFTATMENDLDAIAAGDGTKAEYLHRFYAEENAFAAKIERYEEEIDPETARVIQLEELPVRVLVGPYGPYIKLEDGEETKNIDVPDDVAPADLSMAIVEEQLRRREEGPKVLGEDPESSEPIYLIDGPFGFYVQKGDKTEETPKPPRSSLPKGVSAETVELDYALQLLSLPRELGTHPESGDVISVGLGRYGPYVRQLKEYRSLPNADQLFTLTLEEALALLAQPKGGRRSASVLRELGEHPESGDPINILDGRYGPYVKMGRVNASLPKGTDVEAFTLEEAMALIEAKAASKKTKKKTTKKKTTKKKTTKKKTTRKKKAPAAEETPAEES